MFFSEETVDPSPAASTPPETAENHGDQEPNSPKQRILIGSQRNPDAYRPKPAVPVVDETGAAIVSEEPAADTASKEEKPAIKTGQVVFESENEKSSVPKDVQPDAKPQDARTDTRRDPQRGDRREGGRDGKPGAARGGERGPHRGERKRRDEQDGDGENADNSSETNATQSVPLRSRINIPVPAVRGDLSDDLEEEFAEIFGSDELDSMLTSADQVAAQPQIETDTKQKGKVVSIGRDSAFIELGGREQGAVPLKQFKTEPEVGETIEVKVVRFLAEEGLYELSLPTAAADVADWSQVEEGMVVEAKVSGHNAGGLECEVNRLRAFIPMSQISVFRVENPAEFLGQKLMCIVTECNPMRRNLVLSARAFLEREREENRQKIFNELEIGQIREGLVRKLIESGAFVDLGGVDGFLPISALAWGRVKHPGDVISEGQRIRVRITNIDEVKNRISLSYRDESTDPWLSAEEKFAPKSAVRGKVSKIMDFGAFVELLPGVEGLVHISELSLKRVGSVSEVVQEGDWVDVMVLAVDPTGRKISLSMKQLMTPPEPESSPETEAGAAVVERKEAPLDPVKVKTPRKGPLKGGVSRESDGGKFGLKF